jgi:2-oxoglutarate dehydrogenase E2 component (dihydrolipoamide succinyltransferase)
MDINTPAFPESVSDGTVAKWHKKIGDAVKRDELLVDIETDKVVIEVPAPSDGVLTEMIKKEGDKVLSKELLGRVDEKQANKTEPTASAAVASVSSTPITKAAVVDDVTLSPAVRKMIDENNLDAAKIAATGKGGRITKEDVINHMNKETHDVAVNTSAVPAASTHTKAPDGRPEKRVPMTRLRARIAERLVEAQHNAAMLTTFNEINMKPVMDLRAHYKDKFEQAYGIKLGFMSFFVHACVEALKQFPDVNASIDGGDVVYHGYFDVSVAVSTDRGLVVPVMRNADEKSLAQIEKEVASLGQKAKDGKLSLDEITGGTFTISNGGVFGSLLSTPIINPPQTAILGMHKIQERPVAVDGKVVILPMMYVALSYDHRLIDGKQAVQFLVMLKDLLEDPARMLLEV